MGALGNIVASSGWDHIRIAAIVDPALAWLEGMTIADAAARREMDPLPLAVDTMLADRGNSVPRAPPRALPTQSEVVPSGVSPGHGLPLTN